MPPDENAGAAPVGAAQSTPETPTPSSTPSPEPSSAPGSDYGGLGEDHDDLEVEINLAGDASTPKPAEAAPATPEPAPPVPQPAPAPPPAAPAQAPPAEGPQGSQGAPASRPSEPRTLVEQIQHHRGEILDELARTRFAWDPGEQKAFTEALETDATKALVDWTPRLMSRMYYESATMALNHINQFVPVLIGNYTKLMDQQRDAEGVFFKQFPGLNKQQHWNDIVQFAGIFNRQNPNLSQADLLAMVGAAVMAKNKIGYGAAPNGNGGAPPRKPSTPAFVPAAAGGSPARVVTEPESPYAGLGAHYDDD